MTAGEAAPEPEAEATAPAPRPEEGGGPGSRVRRMGWLRELLDALLVALVFALYARTWVVQPFKIPTGSMEENLLIGDHILVNKFIYGPVRYPIERLLLPMRAPRRGDVVVFKYPLDPERDFIKRCIGLPGDELDIRDKALFLNGKRVEEGAYTYFTDPHTYPESPFVPEYYRTRDQFGPAKVPADRYFCLGDNRDNSYDSRYWGPVPAENLKGRALMVYWSVAEGPEDGAAPAAEKRGVWARLADAVRRSTRWERTFSMVR